MLLVKFMWKAKNLRLSKIILKKKKINGTMIFIQNRKSLSEIRIMNQHLKKQSFLLNKDLSLLIFYVIFFSYFIATCVKIIANLYVMLCWTLSC